MRDSRNPAGRRAVPAFLAAALTLAGALTTMVAGAPPSSAAPGDITTIAGAPGEGPATSIGQLPNSLAVAGAHIFIGDRYVVRMMDTTTGAETVFAGTGIAGHDGDGGPAAAARLDSVYALAADPAGNVYISTAGRVRKVDTAGTITTVAGNGATGTGGEGEPATSSPLPFCQGLVVDGSGNLILSDTSNNRIVKVDAAGNIATVAGSPGHTDYAGDGGPATAATMASPAGITVDGAGNILFVDEDYGVVRSIDAATGVIRTVAQVYGSYALARDELSGAAYVTAMHVVKKVSASGDVTNYAGTTIQGFSGDGGPATRAQLNFPSAVAVDDAGRVLIADSLNDRVRRVDGAGIITTVAGNGLASFSGDGGPATAAQLGSGQDRDTGKIAEDVSGNLFIADRANHRVRKIDPSGTISTVAGNGDNTFSGDGGPATAAGVDAAGSPSIPPVRCSSAASIESVRSTAAARSPHLRAPGRLGVPEMVVPPSSPRSTPPTDSPSIQPETSTSRIPRTCECDGSIPAAPSRPPQGGTSVL